MAAYIYYLVTLDVTKLKIVEFANSVDPNEVAHNEPPHRDLQFCFALCSSVRILNMIELG